MANKMLIDSSHPEETRVVVTRGAKVEEFDFESANRRQLRGNIYLAKVTRVEPSLQAAFIEYGGNRHGFLAFSEIHPDYYQIPVADRQALLDADRDAELDAERDDERRREGRESREPREPREAREGREPREAREGRGGGGRRRRGAQRRNRVEGETVSASVDADEGESRTASSYEGYGETTIDSGFVVEAGSELRASDDGEPAPLLDASPEAAESEDDRADRPVGDSSDETARVDEAEPADRDLALDASDAPPAAEAPLPDDAGDDHAFAETAFEPEPDDERAAPLEARASLDDEDRHSSDDEPVVRAREDAPAEEDDDEDEDEEIPEHEIVENVGGADALEEVPERPRHHRRHYKIQEVIKRRQILLVQVVKEERGNKGAALTTYLSLAGRYSVLMPNTGKGGGISRKITSAEDRKRLKEIVGELEVPDGMGIILRTAGAARSKPEIKRDYEYLMRLWESVRELTLESSAPSLVYEEGSLIKRAIRDLYNKDIDDVIVAGEDGYREAKDFMGMIMPTHAKVVKPYREPQALFAQHGVEAQLDAMFSNHVTLKSGGYLVINPTEALVSIDVNSGRSTREHNIEDTALRTNLEAAEEIARQLRLRDLAGLIVIDFIDMEEGRNDRAVEKKLKDCLKNDRARIQVGRISPFGLLEMSRQRIRTGVLESSSVPCRHCAGTGFVRATPSVALQILRSIEESLLRSATHNVVVRTRTEVAFYILNGKRGHLGQIEARFGVGVMVCADETLAGTTTFAIDRGELASPRPAPTTGIRVDTVMPMDEPIEVDAALEFEREDDEPDDRLDEDRQEDRQGDRQGDGRDEKLDAAAPADGEGEDGRPRRRRRRRRGRGNGGQEAGPGGSLEEVDDGDGEDGAEPAVNGAGYERPLIRPERFDEPSDVAVLPGRAIDPDMELPLPSVGLMIEAGRGEAGDGIAAELSAMAAPPSPEAEAAQILVAPAPAPLPEPEPEPVAIVLTPPDPDRPKRGGWWAKAKSAVGGA